MLNFQRENTIVYIRYCKLYINSFINHVVVHIIPILYLNVNNVINICSRCYVLKDKIESCQKILKNQVLNKLITPMFNYSHFYHFSLILQAPHEAIL